VCSTAGVLRQKPNTTTENIRYKQKVRIRKYPLLEYNQTIMQTQITHITIENYQCELLGKRDDM
jgi:hypothetical protein